MSFIYFIICISTVYSTLVHFMSTQLYDVKKIKVIDSTFIFSCAFYNNAKSNDILFALMIFILYRKRPIFEIICIEYFIHLQYKILYINFSSRILADLENVALSRTNLLSKNFNLLTCLYLSC